MRNLLALLAAAVLVFAGGGWYMGWYRIQRNPAAEGHNSYNLDVDKKKITEDILRTEQRLHKAIENGSKDDSDKKSDSASDKKSDGAAAEPVRQDAKQ